MSFKLGKQIGLSKPADFVLLVIGWFIFGSLCRQSVPESSGIFVIWVFLTSWLSLILLDALGIFERHIPKPKLSGLVVLAFALPMSAFIAKWMLMLTSNVPPVRYSETLWASMGVAILFESAQLLTFKVYRAMGARWLLATHLHADELEMLRTQIQQSGASDWIRIIPIHGGPHGDGHLQGSETIVISRRSAHKLNDCAALLTAHLLGQRIVDVRQLLKEFSGRVSLQNLDAWTFLLASTQQNFLVRFYFYTKSYLEPLIALLLLILLSPILLGVAFAIWKTSGRPILFQQERSGYRGKNFMLYKFRTMTNVAENAGARWATLNDPRVTPIGRWLRKTRIDELPQLLNVLRSDLDFVGPRPERPEFYEMLSKLIPLFSMRLLVRPGITGWAQVRQGYAASIEECKTKLEYDLYYVQNMSPYLDLKVLLQTTALMIRGNGGR